MVRAPCCEKMGLKKGPWTREEDQILINYVNLYGHGNWRALPKQAGLLRCGKSCRLRWTNYLRPDLKRGNFTKEEEDTIINLHGVLGNRWSAIAARLPGRTDNEIKNVWHTHLKKRLKQIQPNPKTKHNPNKMSEFDQDIKEDNFSTQTRLENQGFQPNSPQNSGSDISCVTTTICDTNNMCMKADSLDNFPEMDENFWSDVFSAENSGDFPVDNGDHQPQFPFSPLHNGMEYVCGYNSNVLDGMDFWYDPFYKAGELQKIDRILNL